MVPMGTHELAKETLQVPGKILIQALPQHTENLRLLQTLVDLAKA